MKGKWYEHKSEVVGNIECKVLWDFTVQTDHEMYGRRPDVIVVQKYKNLFQVIDFACPHDVRVNTRELKQIENNQNFVRELRKIWNIKAKLYQ